MIAQIRQIERITIRAHCGQREEAYALVRKLGYKFENSWTNDMELVVIGKREGKDGKKFDPEMQTLFAPHQP